MKTIAWLSALILLSCVPDERPKEEHPSPPAAPTARAREPLAPRPPIPAAALPSGSAAGPAAPPPSADPLLTAEFRDGFNRAAVGPDWTATSPAWHVESGKLCVEHAKNHPIWLKRRLPPNARIEFDATSTSEDGDLKAEYWGDGKSAAETVSYNAATSYLTIFGGWKNQFHVLARIDEHASNRPEVRLDPSSDDPRARRVEPNRSYHFKVVRDDGKTVRWYVDDLEILQYPDPEPLSGPGHDHFGFNDWDVKACFENLVIVPLK
ncbi:MAG TPA: DUF6250 domain-containing protein [Polyangiaceae bacterium]|nr:DUF6250 domain-containing protein [Polyangiaceae bacterium]